MIGIVALPLEQLAADAVAEPLKTGQSIVISSRATAVEPEKSDEVDVCNTSILQLYRD